MLNVLLRSLYTMTTIVSHTTCHVRLCKVVLLNELRMLSYCDFPLIVAEEVEADLQGSADTSGKHAFGAPASCRRRARRRKPSRCECVSPLQQLSSALGLSAPPCGS
jgi:hypothetical protein